MTGRPSLRCSISLLVALLLCACEKELSPKSAYIDDADATVLRFSVADLGVQKLNVMLFDSLGQRVFDKVKTQTISDGDFGALVVNLDAGTYTLVAIAHSSIVSATIKSAANVQFTARDGRKLTDTFCLVDTIALDGSPIHRDCPLQRATAMVRLMPTDDVPATVSTWQFSYTGGSANVNPTTLHGITKSTQSELRLASEPLEVYTFPYMAEAGLLKITISSLASDGSVVCQRTFQDVPIERCRITTIRGAFFSDMPMQTGFYVDDSWNGETIINF